MNAKEAKQISDKANLPDMEKIFSIIRTSACTGATDCWIDFINENDVNYIKTKFQELNYDILEETDSEDTGNFAFHISWEDA